LEIFFEHNPNVLWDSSWDNATCWAPGTGGKYCDPGVLADGGGGVRGVLCADLGGDRGCGGEFELGVYSHRFWGKGRWKSEIP